MGDHVRYLNHQVSEVDKSFKPKYRDILFRVEEILAEGVNYRLISEGLEEPVGLITHYNQLKRVEPPRETPHERPGRERRRPARLEEYDLDDGLPRVN